MNGFMNKNTLLEQKLITSIQDLKARDIEKDGLTGEVLSAAQIKKALEFKIAELTDQLASTKKQLDEKSKDLVQATKRMNQIAAAKSQIDINILMKPDELEALLKQQEQTEVALKADREQMLSTKAANMLLSEQVRTH